MNPPGTRTKERHDTTMATASDLIGGAGIIDCMIGFPASDFSQYEFIRAQLRDSESRDGFDFPVEYMFKNVPKELYGAENPIDITLHEMDRFGVERGLVGGEQPHEVDVLARRLRKAEVGVRFPRPPPQQHRPGVAEAPREDAAAVGEPKVARGAARGVELAHVLHLQRAHVGVAEHGELRRHRVARAPVVVVEEA